MNVPPVLRHPIFSLGIAALGAASIGLAGMNAMQANGIAALVWLGVAIFAAVLWALRDKLPAAFGISLAAAAAVNAAGYTMNLWKDRTPFDEIVHAFTTFAGMAVIGWAVLRHWKRPMSRSAVFVPMIGTALLLGVAWEGVEWAIGIIGSLRDTFIDLVMDLLGAVAAAALIHWVAGRQGPQMADPYRTGPASNDRAGASLS